MTAAYAELVLQARTQLVREDRCARCSRVIGVLTVGRRRIPVEGVTPVRGWQRTAEGRQAILALRDGRVARVSLADDGDVFGWVVHRCEERR